ncbi:hypothetical protein [Archangium violaceum]|uniref:hypothetical protein n=1 Tax=Archangium violaceum TaxID=83451 RepID=UPI0036DE9A91
MMDEFLTFLGEYDSEYPLSVRGASAEMIGRLSAVMGQPVPPIHEEFLLCMGSSIGRLEIPNLSFDIDQIIGLYEAEEWRPPPRYAVIAVEMQDPYFDCYLDLEQPNDFDFGIVRFESWGNAVLKGKVHPWFRSLRDMLFSLGFLYKRMSSLLFQLELQASPAKQQRTGQSQEAVVKTLEELALQMGFKRLRHTNPQCLLLEREDAAIYGHLPPRGGFNAKAAATDRGQLSKICEILRDQTILV